MGGIAKATWGQVGYFVWETTVWLGGSLILKTVFVALQANLKLLKGNVFRSPKQPPGGFIS